MTRRRRRTVADLQDEAAADDPLGGWAPLRSSSPIPSSRLGLRPPLPRRAARRRPTSQPPTSRPTTKRTAKPIAQRPFPLYRPALRKWPRLERLDQRRSRPLNRPDPSRFYLTPAHRAATQRLMRGGGMAGLVLAAVGARVGLQVNPFLLAIPVGALAGTLVGRLRARDAAAIRLELDAEEIEIYSRADCWLDCGWDELASVRLRADDGGWVRLRLDVGDRDAFVEQHPEAGQLPWEGDSMVLDITGTADLMNRLDGALMSYLPDAYRGLAG